LTGRNFLFFVGLVLLSLAWSACSLTRIPTVTDDRIQRLVVHEGRRILHAVQDKDASANYLFLLSDFPRADVLGLSSGHGRIYINYKLAKRAADHTGYRWLLRQILAHEIAHELSGHADGKNENAFHAASEEGGISAADLGLPGHVRFYAYSVEKELEADLNGMKYWRALGWDCGIWVDLLEAFVTLKYAGDARHPTSRRLEQALSACTDRRPTGPVAAVGPTALSR